MQRRHAIIAAIALVALVLIPAAALASGLGGGFGHRGPGPGPKNITETAPDWAGNATAPHWGAGNCTGAGDCAGNANCIGNQTCDGDHAQQRGGDRLGNITGGQNLNRTQQRDRGYAVNQTGANVTAGNPGSQGRGGRGLGR